MDDSVEAVFLQDKLMSLKTDIKGLLTFAFHNMDNGRFVTKRIKEVGFLRRVELFGLIRLHFFCNNLRGKESEESYIHNHK